MVEEAVHQLVRAHLTVLVLLEVLEEGPERLLVVLMQVEVEHLVKEIVVVLVEEVKLVVVAEKLVLGVQVEQFVTQLPVLVVLVVVV